MRHETSITQRITAGLLLVLLLLAAALVWHDLGVREVLGRDENATITKLDQPSLEAVFEVTRIKNNGEPGNMQPLYFLFQYLFWPAVGRNTFMLRFLPSIFGLLVVLLTYKLGVALFGSEAGLVGALLAALLPLHVRYAQILRPYTLLALFSLASAYLLVRAVKTDRRLHWAGFVLMACLGFYTHYNFLFVLAAEGLFAAVVWLTVLVAVLRREQAPGRLVRPALSFLAVGLLCLPGLIRLARLPLSGVEAEVEAAGGVIVSLTVPFFRHFLYESGLATRWQQNLLALLMILGLAAALLRRRWQAALFAVLWLAVPFVFLDLINSPRPFEERYVIFVTPVALLLVGQALAAVGQGLATLARRRDSRLVRWAITLALTIPLVWILVGRLGTYYAYNRQAGRLEETLAVIEHHARPGDTVVVSPRFFVRPLDVQQAEVLYLNGRPSFERLDAVVSQQGRMWILCTSYPLVDALQEPLDRWLQARSDRFVSVPIKALNALAFEAASSADAESELTDRIATLEELARGSAGKSEAWQRYGLLADAYLELADLYAGRGEDALAAQYTEKAEHARAAHPPP
jgi:hypothetical protein